MRKYIYDVISLRKIVYNLYTDTFCKTCSACRIDRCLYRYKYLNNKLLAIFSKDKYLYLYTGCPNCIVK